MDGHFTEFDHSGDIGIEAHGKTLEDVLIHLTQGLFNLMHRGTVGEGIERRVRIQSSSAEDLLIDWLSEVLSLSGVHGELYGAVTVKKIGEHFIEAVLAGQKLNPVKHDLRFEVKAATYHGFHLEERGDDLVARVIFDL
jgi:SHS2 domain-containing protein